MKTLKLSIATFLLIGVASCTTACEDHEGSEKTPEIVSTAFAKKFPNAKKVSWDKENETEWEAEFKMNGVEYSANFTAEGIWKETEYEIKKQDIPTKVKNTLDTKFAGYKIGESEISKKQSGTFYEFALEKSETEIEVAIDANGKVVKKKVKIENDDEDND